MKTVVRTDERILTSDIFDRDSRVAHFTAGDHHTTIALEPGSYQDFYDAMAAAIRDGRPVPVDPQDAVGTMEILEQARQLASA